MKRIMLALAVIASVAFMTTPNWGGGGGDNIARGQASLPAPTSVSAVNGASPGEAVLSWEAVDDAKYYRVGWMADPDYRKALADYPNTNRWTEEFRYSDIANRGQTSRTITRLSPGTDYWFLVGSNESLRGSPEWSSWAALKLAGAPTPSGASGGPIPGSTFSSSALRYQAIDAGKNHTCGIKQDNTVECWGDNTQGQTNAPEGQFLSISAGGVYSCAINFENQLQCWGHAAIPSPPDGNYTHISVGDEHACAITTVVGNENRIICWGLPSTDGRTANRESGHRPWQWVITGPNYSCGWHDGWPYFVCWGSPPRYNYSQERLTIVSAGSEHTCGLYTNAAVACRGSDVHEQVSGIPIAEDEGAAEDFYTYRAVAAGGRHSCGVRTTGNIRCWGDNLRGQATPPGNNDELRAGEVGVGDFIAVSAGDAHTCGLRDNGVAVCWGENNHGQATPR